MPTLEGSVGDSSIWNGYAANCYLVLVEEEAPGLPVPADLAEEVMWGLYLR